MSSDADSATFARSIMILRRVPRSVLRASCCVHRAFLSARVRLSGRWFGHGRQSVGDRKPVLAAIVGTVICGQAVMSKPLDAVAWKLPEAASRSSDGHVVERWMRGHRQQDQIARARVQARTGLV